MSDEFNINDKEHTSENETNFVEAKYEYSNSTNGENSSFTFNGDEHNKRGNKDKKGGSFFKSLAIGIVGAVIGGSITTAVTLYTIPNMQGFKNTPLYNQVKDNVKGDLQGELKNVSSVTPNSTSNTKVEGKQGLSVPEIVKKVSPAVVCVSVKGIQIDSRFGIPTNMEGVGSGVIFRDDGYILTNNHVIQGAQDITVIFNNNKQVKAKVVNSDPKMDLAVIKVLENVPMPGVVEFGESSSLQVGELAVALGNPLGKEFIGTVTTGIVSAVNRNLSSESKDGSVSYIQTNAAINSGNSGGALVDSQGKLIGINTAKIAAEGVEGIGFAIPVDIIKTKIPELVKPVLNIGIQGRVVTEEIAKANDLPEGIYVANVVDFSAAEKAGIKPGDVIVAFDGVKIKSIEDLNAIKSKHKEGDVVKVEVMRETNGKVRTLDFKFE